MLNKNDDDNQIDIYEKELGLLLLKYLKIPLVTTLSRDIKREKDWECIGTHNEKKLVELCNNASVQEGPNSPQKIMIRDNKKIIFTRYCPPSYWENDKLCVFDDQYNPIPLYQFLTSFNVYQTNYNPDFFSNDEVKEIFTTQEYFTLVNIDFNVKHLVDSMKKNKTYSLHAIRKREYKDTNGEVYKLGNHMIPFDDKIPFCKNYEFFCQNCIILTDNLAIVNIFSHAANNNGFIFCGIYVPQDVMDPQKYEWSELEGYNIYYLLLEHSGHNTFSTYERANYILGHIQSNKLNIKLRFIRIPYNTENRTCGSPEFLNVEKFENAFAYLTSLTAPMEGVKQLLMEVPPIRKKQDVVAPYFKTGECHFLYGGTNGNLVRLCAMLGLSVAMGDNFVPSIKSNGQFSTLYINRRMAIVDFENILEETLCSRWIESEQEKEMLDFHVATDIRCAYPDDQILVHFYPTSFMEISPKYKNHLCSPNLLKGKNDKLKWCTCKILNGEYHLKTWHNILILINDLSNPYTTIIIDLCDIFIMNHPNYHIHFCILYDILNCLKRDKCVIVIGPEVLLKQGKIYQLPFDKIYHFENIKPKDPSEISLKLNVELGDIPKANSNRVFTYSKIKGWFLEDRKLTKLEIEMFVKKNWRLSIKEMMVALNLSESQVKTLRKKSGIAKSVPQRKPRFPTNRKGKPRLFTGKQGASFLS